MSPSPLRDTPITVKNAILNDAAIRDITSYYGWKFVGEYAYDGSSGKIANSMFQMYFYKQ